MMSAALRVRNEEQVRTDYAEQRTSVRAYPVFLFVELTQNCNAGCRMCRGAIQPVNPDRNMAPGLFRRIAEALFPYVSIVDLHGWGESTVLPGFSQTLQTTLESGVRVRLITNAIAMTEGLWEIVWTGDNIIGVSLDTADAETFRRLGRGDFDKVVRNLRTGVAIRRRSGLGSLYLNVVVSSYTLLRLPRVVELAADLHIEKIVLNRLKCPPCQRAHLSHVRSKIPPVLDRTAALATKEGIALQLGSALDRTLVVRWGVRWAPWVRQPVKTLVTV